MRTNEYIIAFKENKILVKNPGNNEKDPLLLISFLGQLGRALSPDVKGIITSEEEKEILDSITPWAVETFGLGKRWLTVYDNPELLLAKTPEELREDQISLYLSPEVIKEIKNRDGEDDFWTINNYKIIKVLEPIDKYSFGDISRNLLSSTIPLGPEKMESLSWFLENPEYLIVPGSIPVKENLCRVLDYMPDYKVSSTDILRYFCYLNGYPVSNPGEIRLEDVKINHKGRTKVNYILTLLANSGWPESLAVEMNKYRESWIVLLKTCHPKDEKVIRLFKVLYGKDTSWKKLGWGNKVRRAYDEHDWKFLVKLYQERPGEFMRHYDSLLRRFAEDKEILGKIMNLGVFSGVPGKTLISLSYYYDSRDRIKSKRSYRDKKGVRRYYDKELPEIDNVYVLMTQSQIKSALSLRYIKQPSLEGKTYLFDFRKDSEIKLSERSEQSGGTENGLQGVKLDIPKTGLLRFFVQWIDPNGYNDLDLHAQALIGDEKLVTVGWNSEFTQKSAIIHSGDIRFQKGDCAEFITVDMEKAIEEGFTKIVISADDYEGHQLGTSCETYIGYSIVTKMRVDSKWSPLKSNTPFRAKLSKTSARYMCLYVVDLVNGWMKVITESTPQADYWDASDMITHFIDKTLTLGELMELNIKCRNGKVVTEVPDEKEGVEVIRISREDCKEWENYLLG
jgi:hypothetical protein